MLGKNSPSLNLLAQEARALLVRLAMVKPYALHMPMVPAAAALVPLALMDRHQRTVRRMLSASIQSFLRWLASRDGQQATPMAAQRRFTVLRMKFNSMLSQFDIFSDVLTQRSEHGYGVWLAGLDVLATDALTLQGNYYQIPPVICFLNRGAGAAIRRARTRLPGGEENPVAIIQVPRERMVGSAIASSLVHECGHQASALLDLPAFFSALLGERARRSREPFAWRLYGRWISEILADFWSIGKIGVGSTLGLMGVVSLPRAFVFRISLDDPHPIPWIRVKLSCAIGKALYPHPQWDRLSRIWESLYPTEDLDIERREMLTVLERTIPDFVDIVANQQVAAVNNRSLAEALSVRDRQPANLARHWRRWREFPHETSLAQPTLAFAALGQAKADGAVSPEVEGRLVDALLVRWAQRQSPPGYFSSSAGTWREVA